MADAPTAPEDEAPEPPRAARTKRRTRIQQENEEKILDSALEAFSQHGFKGATLDQIAEGAGMSKPNLLYYFRRKEDIHAALMTAMLEEWLEPLAAITEEGDAMKEIRAYVRRKLDMAREKPRESRLFASEVMSGAPRIESYLSGNLKDLVDEKAEVIRAWIRDGKIRKVDPYHLIFAIWATTQHYADFDVQVRAVLGVEGDGHIDDAARFLEGLFLRGLAPDR